MKYLALAGLSLYLAAYDVPAADSIPIEDAIRVISGVPHSDTLGDEEQIFSYVAEMFKKEMAAPLLAILADKKYRSLWIDALWAIGVIGMQNKDAVSVKEVISSVERIASSLRYGDRDLLYSQGYDAIARIDGPEAVSYLLERSTSKGWLNEKAIPFDPKPPREADRVRFQRIATNALRRMDPADINAALLSLKGKPELSTDEMQTAISAALASSDRDKAFKEGIAAARLSCRRSNFTWVLPRLDVDMAFKLLGINDKQIYLRCKDFGAQIQGIAEDVFC